MAENQQNIVIKYSLDTSEFNRAERALSNLTDEERKLKNEAQSAGNEAISQADKIVNSSRKQKRSIDELQKEYATLQRAIRQALDPKKATEYKKALAGIETEMQGINKQGATLNKGIGGLSSSFKGLGTALIAGFAVERVIDFGRALATLENQIAQTRGQLQRLSKTQGETLDDLTARVRALASTYGIAEEELIKVVNAFEKQANLDFVTALDLIEKGFLQVGTASGEFSDSIREYTRLLIQAGATAEEVVKIAAIQDLEGVFNDKLIDSVFNFSNELRDTQKALRVLTNTFGNEFATRAVNDFNSGTATALDILQRIGKEAERTGKSTQELAEVTTDLGTGVAEDIGGILEVYRLYNKALELNADNLDTLGQRQAEVLRSAEAYEASLVRLANNFEGFGAKTEEYAKGAGRVLANLVSEFVELFDSASDRLERFKKGLENADPTTFGNDIERTQERVNQLASQLQNLNVQYQEAQEKARQAGTGASAYTGILSGLGANIAKTKEEFTLAKTQLDLLIDAKEKATMASDSFAKASETEATTLAKQTGLIAKLRLELQELTKAREGASTEGQIIALNKRIKATEEELKALLNLSDAKEKETSNEVQRLEVGTQVSDDLTKVQIANIEKVSDANSEATQSFFEDEEAKAEKAKEIAFEIAQAGANLLQSIADFRTAQIDAQLASLEKETEERIRLAGNNEKAIEKIREDAARKEQALLERQAQIRKNAQIQQAIIAGAQGVAQAIARAELFPFNFVLAGLIATQTALQVATIRSTPAFKDGTEYVQGPGTTTSDSINARLSKGERVVKASTNKQLAGIRNDELPNAVRAYTALKDLRPDLADKAGKATGTGASMKGLKDAIKDGFKEVTVNESNYNEAGFSRYQRRKNSRIRVIDENNTL